MLSTDGRALEWRTTGRERGRRRDTCVVAEKKQLGELDRSMLSLAPYRFSSRAPFCAIPRPPRPGPTVSNYHRFFKKRFISGPRRDKRANEKS